MNYNEAIQLVEHKIYKNRKEIDSLLECIKYLNNESQSNDDLTQSPEQILANFGLTMQ